MLLLPSLCRCLAALCALLLSVALHGRGESSQLDCDLHLDSNLSAYVSARVRYFFNSTEDDEDTAITIVPPGKAGRHAVAAEVLGVIIREIFRYPRTIVLPHDHPCPHPYACAIRLDQLYSTSNHYIDSGFLYSDSQDYFFASPSDKDCPLSSEKEVDLTYITLMRSKCTGGPKLSPSPAEAAGYAHISRQGGQQKKLLLTDLAARDRQLARFLRSFQFPDDDELLHSANACRWLRTEMERQLEAAKAPWELEKMSDIENRLPLRIALLWPSGKKMNDSSILANAQQAVDGLNSHICRLGSPGACQLREAGLVLQLQHRGMDCDKADALHFYSEALCRRSGSEAAGAPLLGMVAGTCSDTVGPIAELSSQVRSVVVSPTVESAVFNDPQTYPYFFRTIPSLDAYPNVVSQFLRRYNWHDVTLLSSGKLFLRRDQFERRKGGLAVCFEEVADEESLTLKQAHETLANAKQRGCQVYAMDYMQRGTCLYLCAAYKLNMTQANNYMFILSDSAKNVFYENNVNCDVTDVQWYNGSTGGCTDDQLRTVAEGHLIVRNEPHDSQKSDVVGLSKQRLLDYYGQVPAFLPVSR